MNVYVMTNELLMGVARPVLVPPEDKGYGKQGLDVEQHWWDVSTGPPAPDILMPHGMMDFAISLPVNY
jgi:hypothetical protein